ncbi:uncharacterized protein PF3D7_1120000-like [Dermacentor albipictus]|uniref:uncharacterized protein PF3D7_1120000-like n=1 Tax=Dermacentor albipictus TaxID=60249 RepID=UPI0031FDF226
MTGKQELSKLFEELKRELKNEFRELRECLERDLRKEIREMKGFLEFANKNYEEMKTSVSELKNENSDIRNTVEGLEKDRAALLAKLKDHEVRLMQNDQHTRGFNIEIKGVPTKPKENTLDITRKLAGALDVPFEDSDAQVCHRIRTSGNANCPNIVVQFRHRAKRDSFLEKARKKQLTTEDIQLEPSTPIYINKHLSPPMKRLFVALNSKKKELGWKYAWYRNGKIFARKSDGSPIVAICHLDDLQKMA